MEHSKYIEKTFLSEDGLVDKTVKTRSLNGIMVRIKDLEALSVNENIMTFLDAIKSVLEDAYRIDMYKFQFKLLTLSLNKELDNIQKMIDNE